MAEKEQEMRFMCYAEFEEVYGGIDRNEDDTVLSIESSDLCPFYFKDDLLSLIGRETILDERDHRVKGFR